MASKQEQKDTGKEQITGAQITSFIKAEVAASVQGVLQQIQEQLARAKDNGLSQLADAYIKAVGAARDPVKNAANPHLRNTYADLGSVLDGVREAFLSNGLWLMQFPGEITVKGGGSTLDSSGVGGYPYMALHGILLHKSGQSISFKMELPAFSFESKKNGGGMIINPQTSGSALSYARRYMWFAVGGLTQVDDDGDAASYQDGAEGPAVEQRSVAQVRSTPLENSAAEDMIKKLNATTTLDELKALRTDAQALANRLNNKGITSAYMQQWEKFKAA